MEDSERTLVVLLSMHRCGSSLTANIMQRLGMSLGPFELIEARPDNPHGFYESKPFYGLNRRVQHLALGFPDDLPESPETLARVLAMRGEWDESTLIPEDLLAEGRSLVGALIDSGRVSGFKDPRTVLTWPFWMRVLGGFTGLRVVPMSLVRSPHEVAMSLVTRVRGWFGYWSALDLIAVHLLRQKAVLESFTETSPSICFGSSSYLDTLKVAVSACGLTWNQDVVLDVVDPTCVHHTPAAVDHEAQQLFDSLTARAGHCSDPETNCAQLEADYRALESARLQQWHSAQAELESSRAQLAQSHEAELQCQIRLQGVATELSHTSTAYHDTSLQLDDTRSQLAALQIQFTALEAEFTKLQSALIDIRERERLAHQESNRLRLHIDRYESHPVLGPALRGQRRLRKLLRSIAPGAANGRWRH
jgi:hypothetical protein